MIFKRRRKRDVRLVLDNKDLRTLTTKERLLNTRFPVKSAALSNDLQNKEAHAEYLTSGQTTARIERTKTPRPRKRFTLLRRK